MKPVAIQRRQCTGARQAWPDTLHPLLARVFAARGLEAADAAQPRLADLAAPSTLGGIGHACELLAQAIADDLCICVVGDFDADGATGTAVALRGLRLLGARKLCYRVPNRFRDGYGLSVGVVESLGDVAPDLIVTVDNGIASHAGVAAARARGMRVIVTDPHLPGASLPPADAIVNPNLAGDAFPSKMLAGVGVMFYLLLALRAHMYPGDPPDRVQHDSAGRDRMGRRERPELVQLLDLVALGTVADLVPLDANNRILVEAGLKRIRAGRCCAGITALYRAAGRHPARAVASDLGFALGPRINAAGRLEDMALGIECLLTDDVARAETLAAQLSAINSERRELQSAMVEQAEANVATFMQRHAVDALPYGIVLHEPDWHPGVVGLVASKLKERLNRPVVACAPAEEGGADLRASARSIAGFHLRDALAEIDAGCPGLIARFGGHAMAAGLTLARTDLARFAAEFDAVARRRIDASLLDSVLWSDGELAADDFSIDAARALRYAGPWGQGFAEPAFDNVFAVESWRVVGERHLKLRLRPDGGEGVDAILFDALESTPPPARVRVLFQLDLNEWNGRESLQLLVRHLEPA